MNIIMLIVTIALIFVLIVAVSIIIEKIQFSKRYDLWRKHE